MRRWALLYCAAAVAAADSTSPSSPRTTAAAAAAAVACTTALQNATFLPDGSPTWPAAAPPGCGPHAVLGRPALASLFAGRRALFIGNSMMRHLTETIELVLGPPLPALTPTSTLLEELVNNVTAFEEKRKYGHFTFQQRLQTSKREYGRTTTCDAHHPEAGHRPLFRGRFHPKPYVQAVSSCAAFDAPLEDGSTAALVHVFTDTPPKTITW